MAFPASGQEFVHEFADYIQFRGQRFLNQVNAAQ
jgi:hypothetical protein